MKIRDLISSATKKLDDYDKIYIKIKLNSDDELPLNKAIEMPFFYENNKYYPQVFLDECLYKI